MKKGSLLQCGLLCLMFGMISSSCFGQKDIKHGSEMVQDTVPLHSSDSLSSPTPQSPVSLSIYEYEVVDTSEYATFRLYVRNSTDSLVVLDRVEPSCGCIMTTVQNRFARKEKDAEIYVGLSTDRMSDTQPFTIDVYTSANPESPMRLYIRKKILKITDEAQP